MLSHSSLTVLAILSAVGVARAEVVDRYGITPQEHAACDGDAERLCVSAFPDEDKLIQCMRNSRDQLTPVCLASLQAGLKRRHLPM